MPDHEDVAAEATVESGGAAGEPESAVDSAEEPVLPEPVRQRVVTLAAAAMTGMPVEELPVPLRRVAKFAPNRRAKLGGATIAAHLTSDPLFRQRSAARAVDAAGELGLAVCEGSVPAAADPVEVAALAYLARPPGWDELVAKAARTLQMDAESAAVTGRLVAAEHRAARAEHERAVAKVEAEKLRDELTRLRAEAAGLRDEVRNLTRTVREAQARERKATEMVATEKGRAARAAADTDAELRRVRARLTDAELAATEARTMAKEARTIDEVRLWLLLETIGQAAVGLKRELAVEPANKLPADFVAEWAAQRPGKSSTRALTADDPVRLDQLLALPRAHLIVDGYNVTKRGYGDVSLEQQRVRLINGLGAIAAQSGAEITVAFDGAEKLVAVPGAPRGVRVLFSRKGETADELIRQLVRAEPAGRPVIVISSDREVADGVRRHGAYPLSADTLLRRLSRA